MFKKNKRKKGAERKRKGREKQRLRERKEDRKKMGGLTNTSEQIVLKIFSFFL